MRNEKIILYGYKLTLIYIQLILFIMSGVQSHLRYYIYEK